VQISGIIKVCNYDSDCIPNAYCKEQSYCQCKRDYIFYVTGTNNFSCLEGKDATSGPAAFTGHVKYQDGLCGRFCSSLTPTPDKLQEEV
jgi:hypothetical protein